MIEDQARETRCCGPNGCGTLINPASGGKIPSEMLLQLAVEVNSPRWCIASDCMCWVWDDGKVDTLGALQAEGLGVRVLKNSGHCGLAK